MGNHEKAEIKLKEEKAKCTRLEEELLSLKSLSESRSSVQNSTKAASDEMEKLRASFIQEQKLHAETKKMEQELQYEESANNKLKLLAGHAKKASATIAKQENDLEAERIKCKQLEEELMSLKSLSESQSSVQNSTKAASDEMEKLKASLIQEQKLHAETKKMEQELQAKVSELESSLQTKSVQPTELKEPKENTTAVRNPSSLSKEELVDVVLDLQAEQQSHLRQLQQYHQIMTDSSKPEAACSSGSGVVASVAAFHLKSHNYHLEKQNIAAEKQLKKVQELLKNEKCKFREMEQKKEYWKCEFGKLKFGKLNDEKVATTSTIKPLKDNNTPAVHQSPARRTRGTIDVFSKSPSKKQKTVSSLSTPQTWLDEEIDKISAQENCKTQ
ncbi:hypothetical protein HOLleu_19809 [Holothuria leucospilota]|uniref:Uncharacterized protein n=1 Tax=Holothuria leucospilota TaxID=206669 RepID=A0A9Q1C0K3_HOLLE|nr:hypothetical protein HOLleu_19809 [Holothuria leucospilota]